LVSLAETPARGEGIAMEMTEIRKRYRAMKDPTQGNLLDLADEWRKIWR
jgi:hypothetical protein